MEARRLEHLNKGDAKVQIGTDQPARGDARLRMAVEVVVDVFARVVVAACF